MFYRRNNDGCWLGYMTRLIFRIVILLIGFSREKVLAEEEPVLIGFHYGTTIVFNEEGSEKLILLTGSADPILYASKAYLTAWKLDSLDQLNKFLDLQRNIRGWKPDEIDEKKSSHFVLDIPNHSRFDVFGTRLAWLPNDSESGYINVGFLGRKITVANLYPWRIRPAFAVNDFVTVDEYTKRFDRERSELSRKRLEGIQPRPSHEIWR